MPGNPLIYYILCDRELFVGDVFTYIHVSTPGTVAYDNVSSLVENTLSSLLKIVYIVFDVSGKELYSKPTISLRLVFVVLSVIMWRLCYAQAKWSL